MRKLNTSDVFAMARGVRASGMREELRGLIKQAAETEAKVEDDGIDGVGRVVVIDDTRAVSMRHTVGVIGCAPTVGGVVQQAAQPALHGSDDNGVAGTERIVAMQAAEGHIREKGRKRLVLLVIGMVGARHEEHCLANDGKAQGDAGKGLFHGYVLVGFCL